MKSTFLISVLLVACGGGGGSSPDAAHDSATVPAMVTITGTASARGLSGATPVAGVVVEAHKVSDDSVVTMTTTDAMGNYTLTITTNGQALDGYIKATASTYLATYLYPPGPIAADYANASLNMLTQQNYDLLSTLAQGNQQAANGVVAVEVVDATMTAVAGATVSSTPAGSVVRYDGSNGLPSSSATSTGADGVGYIFNVPPGAATVSAMGTATYKSHPVKSYAGSLCTTLITP